MNYYLGADPGQKGAITVIDDDLQVVEAFLMPLGSDNKIDIHSLCMRVAMIARLYKPVPYLEFVHAIFNTPAKITFNFGRNFGVLHTALISAGLHPTLVRPKIWQATSWTDRDLVKKENGKNDPKKTSYNAATRIFKGHKFYITKDGLFDSALIAYHGRENELDG